MPTAKPRFRFVTTLKPGTTKFTLRIVELGQPGKPAVRRKKTKKEKRRIRKLLRAEKEKIELENCSHLGLALPPPSIAESRLIRLYGRYAPELPAVESCRPVRRRVHSDVRSTRPGPGQKVSRSGNGRR